MKVLITGGHLTPALAVIKERPKGMDVVYVGRKYALEGDSALSLEYQTITNLGIPFIVFHPGRLQRRFTRHTLFSLGRFPKGIWEAFRILKKEKPDVVLSFGGYVAFPIAVAASLLKIPVITHEQTLEVGAANALIAKLAIKVCVSWPSSEKFFPKEKVVLTGNPIVEQKPSQEMQALICHHKEKYPLLVITGGSLGSHAINILIEPMLDKLLAHFTILHQTGNAKQYGDYDRLVKKRNKMPYTFQERYLPTKFLAPDDMPYIYEQADLVISRSGINTVLTLLLANTPSLLIPLPISQRQEQLKNALLLRDSGLGEVLEQDSLTSETLFEAVLMMMRNKTVYKNKDLETMRSLHQHAAEHILRVVDGTKTYPIQAKT